jgi:hypothetical protein
MLTEDRKAFAESLNLAINLKNGEKNLELEQIKFWWSLFELYTIEAFKGALNRAVIETRGRLTPDKVFQFLPCPLGHPSTEEAWNAAPKSESETAYVTDQIMVAISAADDSIQRGDMISARMCFKEVYERAVNEAKTANKRAVFRISYGTGNSEQVREEERKKAITSAHARGWISDQVYRTKMKAIEKHTGNVASLEDLREGLEKRKLNAAKHIAKLRETLNGKGKH